MTKCDNIIVGAGLYGLYSSLFLAKLGKNVTVLEADSAPFMRATYINQARIHMGYHYPRSISTAVKSRKYFDRFCEDYPDCTHSDFDQVYATSDAFSWTNAKQFRKFCSDANIFCEDLPVSRYFKDGVCDGAFMTKEYTYDAAILCKTLLNEISSYKNITIEYNSHVTGAKKLDAEYVLRTSDGREFSSAFVLNSTYAGVNELHNLLGLPTFEIKYELCEIILCTVSKELENVGITVMDGPFFSIMPFGKTGLHSLTSVTFTPHTASHDALPTYKCQHKRDDCTPENLQNCNSCPYKPETAYPYMSGLARKYLKNNYNFEYHSSLFSVKPILKASEIDDSRPTVVRKHTENPTFISVLSGKINTVYDLDEVLTNDSK